MSGSNLAFMGDLHLSRTIYSKIPNMVQDTTFALQQFARFCEDQGAAAVFLGDTFDTPFPSAEMLSAFFKTMQNVDLANIVGQHDRQPYIQWPEVEAECGSKLRLDLSISDKGYPTFFGDIMLWGLNHTPRALLKSELAAVHADTEILCLHQTIKQVISVGKEEDVETRRWDLDMEWVPDDVEHTILADWHYPEAGTTGNRKWLYTGSATMRSISEPVEKSFISVTRKTDGRGGLQFDRIPLKTRPFIFVDLKLADEFDAWCSTIDDDVTKAYDTAIAADIPHEVAIPLVVLRFDVSIDDAQAKLHKALGSRIHKGMVFVHLLPVRSFVEAVPDYVDVDAGVSVQAAVDEVVDPEISPEVHKLATELATAAAPRDVVTAYKHKNAVMTDPGTV